MWYCGHILTMTAAVWSHLIDKTFTRMYCRSALGKIRFKRFVPYSIKNKQGQK